MSYGGETESRVGHRIERVNPLPAFQAQCVVCGRKLQSDRDPIYADLDGKPWVDYLCSEHPRFTGLKAGSFDR